MKHRADAAADTSAPKGAMIYLSRSDRHLLADLEGDVKKADVDIPGRIGISLLVRAGLRLLKVEFDRHPKRAIELVASVASETLAESQKRLKRDG